MRILPTPPIVICDRAGVDLSVHDSVDDALLGLEVVDVRDEQFVAFDSLGRLLRVTAASREGSGQRRQEVIAVIVAEDKPQHAGQLHSRLLAYLVAVGVEEGQLRERTMSELLAIVRQYERHRK